MIVDASEVTDAVVALLRSTGLDVGDQTAPDPTPAVYAVVEHPPGSRRDGALACPDDHAIVRVRVRAVARAESTAVARKAAQRMAHRTMVLLLNRRTPIAGDGWEVTSRTFMSSAGLDDDGPVANQVDDYELWAVPA